MTLQHRAYTHQEIWQALDTASKVSLPNPSSRISEHDLVELARARVIFSMINSLSKINTLEEATNVSD